MSQWTSLLRCKVTSYTCACALLTCRRGCQLGCTNKVLNYQNQNNGLQLAGGGGGGGGGGGMVCVFTCICLCNLKKIMCQQSRKCLAKA